MKTTFKTLVLVLVTVLFTSLGNLNAQSTASTDGQRSSSYCGVSDAQIVTYMAEQGIHVLTLFAPTGTCNVIATAVGGKKYIVFISNGVIIDYEEVLS